MLSLNTELVVNVGYYILSHIMQFSKMNPCFISMLGGTLVLTS